MKGRMRRKESGFNARVLMPLFIVVIMVMSAFGYMWGSSSSSLDYNGFKIYQPETGGFMLKLDAGTRILFRYFPSDLEWINSTPGISERFSSPMIYAAYSPETDYIESFAQVQYNLGQVLSKAGKSYAQPAFTMENEYNLPVVSCTNATQYVPVVVFELSSQTEIRESMGCITVSAKNREELLQAYERLLYTILGVMS